MQTKSGSLQPQKNRLKLFINFAFKFRNKVIKFADNKPLEVGAAV